ncbi:hypothetical protein BDN72DRAFT_859394 [Pluteus cervinus]|uniref:Uncharacterized protein n=1 Tax=Pluteus cervinus TaxID=181527 RepID=A0ACD3AN19_9AGAR|nr:hypothetical protein BDN72DRAFT_859394 [Pluteus cervinus]
MVSGSRRTVNRLKGTRRHWIRKRRKPDRMNKEFGGATEVVCTVVDVMTIGRDSSTWGCTQCRVDCVLRWEEVSSSCRSGGRQNWNEVFSLGRRWPWSSNAEVRDVGLADRDQDNEVAEENLAQFLSYLGVAQFWLAGWRAGGKGPDRPDERSTLRRPQR